jgi:excisionase family DNA binding protein
MKPLPGMITFKIGQLARLLGVHRNTISNWIKNGRLNATPTLARQYMISSSDFKQFCKMENIPTAQVDTLLAQSRQKIENPPLPFVKEETHPMYSITQTSPAKTGSVMVVGGGIAGIQASLDLAGAGFFVYLVEKSAGIGGAMAQLDKTFPTNDCAM